MTILFYEVRSAALEFDDGGRAIETRREAFKLAHECQPYAASVELIETTLKGRELYAALANREGFVSKRTRLLTLNGEASGGVVEEDEE